MDFTFNEDQLLFQKAVRDFLDGECTPEVVRALWEQERRHSPELWAKLAELGIPGLLVPEAHEGMGMDEIDSVLLFEEVGRAALPEPVVATAAVAVPLLVELGSSELSGRWLKRIAVGEAVGHLFHEAIRERDLPCGCGRRATECPFWRRVDLEDLRRRPGSLEHRSVHRRRAHAREAHAALPVLVGQRLGEGHHGELRRRVRAE